MTQMIAEVLYPTRLETEPKVGAWISGAGQVTGGKRKELQSLLPPDAVVSYENNVFRIEADVPSGQRDKMSVRMFAESIGTAIWKGLGVRPGFCPVTSSVSVLNVTRRG